MRKSDPLVRIRFDEYLSMVGMDSDIRKSRLVNPIEEYHNNCVVFRRALNLYSGSSESRRPNISCCDHRAIPNYHSQLWPTESLMSLKMYDHYCLEAAEKVNDWN